MKKRLITLIASAAIVSMAAFAFAGQRGGKGRAIDPSSVTPEQRATIQKIIDAHQDKLYELREKIWAKHAELQALSTSGKAEKADIQSLVADISKLRETMHQERLTMRNEIEKQTGLKPFGPGGYHHGGMGMGYGGGDCNTGGGMGGRGGGACFGGSCN